MKELLLKSIPCELHAEDRHLASALSAVSKQQRLQLPGHSRNNPILHGGLLTCHNGYTLPFVGSNYLPPNRYIWPRKKSSWIS